MLFLVLDQIIVFIVLLMIVGELGGLDKFFWVVIVYIFSFIIVVLLYGKFGDLFGCKIVLQVVIGLFFVGFVFCGLVQNMIQLVLMCGLQGFGGGGLMVISMVVVVDVILFVNCGCYQGLFGGVFGLVMVIGLLIGGFLVQYVFWCWIFYINLLFGLFVLLVIGVVFYSSNKCSQYQIDWLGVIYFSMVLLCIILFILEGGSVYVWNDLQLWCILVFGIVGIIGFIYEEWMVVELIILLVLFCNCSFLLCSLIGFVIGMLLFGLVIFLLFYLQVVKEVMFIEVGLQLIFLMGGLLLILIISGWIISCIGKYCLFLIFGILFGVIGMVLLICIIIYLLLWQLYLFIGVLGVGLGLVMQVLVLVVQNVMLVQMYGVVIFGVILFCLIGGFIGVVLFGVVFMYVLQSNL